MHYALRIRFEHLGMWYYRSVNHYIAVLRGDTQGKLIDITMKFPQLITYIEAVIFRITSFLKFHV